MNLYINHERFYQSIEEISQFCLPDRPWTRRAFTPIYQKARDWFVTQAKSLGAITYYDDAGNLVSRFQGNGQSNKTIMIGSHLDTVPNGGRFDGIMGVLAGLEIAKVLKENNIILNHHFEIVDFLSEEPSDFGLSCIGSRGLTGMLSNEMLDFTNHSGVVLKDAIDEYKGNISQLLKGEVLRDDIACFLEYHIEQGHVLESKNIDIGVVTSIVGLTKVRLHLKGQSNHAGTTPMALRKDSMVCLSDIVLAMNEKATQMNEQTGHYLVATAGKVSLLPNATNVIAGEAEVVFDIRSDHQQTQQLFVDWLEDYCQSTVQKYQNQIKAFDKLSDSTLSDCDSALIDLFVEASNDLNYSYQKMPSGAGHDCAYMSKIVPSAMIFCPSQGGLSHAPGEYSDQDMVGKGCDVLLRTLLKADQKTY